ncbi:MAG TPA: DUF177 domain-containing protein [Bacteroidales bacterium]|nr:DUF177 domain-containing protein [Bacteroidales bacterium]
MKVLAQYSIPFRELDNSDHEYNFTVSDSFFKCFENSEIFGSDIEVKLILSKKSCSLDLNISLCGKVKIKCDRCLEEYYEDINFNDNIGVEFGDETNFDTNEDYVILDRNANEINISQFVFEFAHFALPLVHYHPNDKDGKSGCNPKMIEALQKYSDPKRIKKADPRWEKLQEIKNKM